MASPVFQFPPASSSARVSGQSHSLHSSQPSNVGPAVPTPSEVMSSSLTAQGVDWTMTAASNYQYAPAHHPLDDAYTTYEHYSFGHETSSGAYCSTHDEHREQQTISASFALTNDFVTISKDQISSEQGSVDPKMLQQRSPVFAHSAFFHGYYGDFSYPSAPSTACSTSNSSSTSSALEVSSGPSSILPSPIEKPASNLFAASATSSPEAHEVALSNEAIHTSDSAVSASYPPASTAPKVAQPVRVQSPLIRPLDTMRASQRAIDSHIADYREVLERRGSFESVSTVASFASSNRASQSPSKRPSSTSLAEAYSNVTVPRAFMRANAVRASQACTPCRKRKVRCVVPLPDVSFDANGKGPDTRAVSKEGKCCVRCEKMRLRCEWAEERRGSHVQRRGSRDSFEQVSSGEGELTVLGLDISGPPYNSDPASEALSPSSTSSSTPEAPRRPSYHPPFDQLALEPQPGELAAFERLRAAAELSASTRW